jgi:hypothetical protein
VYNNFTGEYELGPELETEGTVTTIVTTNFLTFNITVGFADGVVKRYTLWEEEEWDVSDPEEDRSREYPDLIPFLLIVGGIVAIAMLIYRIRNPVVRG